MAKEENSLFKTLNAISVKDHVETRNRMTYLSWAHAWKELQEVYPGAHYEIKKFTNPITGVTLPYLVDDDIGFMVFTEMTVGDLTREMWLPVMDTSNKALKPYSYTYKVKEYKQGQWTGQFVEKEVPPASMFDVNKTIMRCLTKNIAMFGLGLNLYSGEDFPEEIVEEQPPKTAKAPVKEAPKEEATPKKKLSITNFERAKKLDKEKIKVVLNTYTMTKTQRDQLQKLLK